MCERLVQWWLTDWDVTLPRAPDGTLYRVSRRVAYLSHPINYSSVNIGMHTTGYNYIRKLGSFPKFHAPTPYFAVRAYVSDQSPAPSVEWQSNKNEVHQKDNISRILWYSDWLHNTTSAGNSFFCNQSQYYFLRKKYYATYRTTV